jgi:3-oxoacyl-[acyl-carrier protein] reductase
VGNCLNLPFEHKRALITGGTHGIGRAICLSLANQGCAVATFSSDMQRVSAMNNELKKISDKNFCIKSDVFFHQDYTNVFDKIQLEWGGIDILINNVGGGGRWGDECFTKTDEHTWNEVVEKNLYSSIRYTKHFLPHMLKNGWGRVISITSIYGKDIGGRPWFNVAKSSQNVLMKNLSKNHTYSSRGVTFNSVAPGPIYIKDTGWAKLKHEDPDTFNDYVKQNIPREVMGTPEEVADIVVFLCSDKSKLINGAVIPCDGGQGISI